MSRFERLKFIRMRPIYLFMSIMVMLIKMNETGTRRCLEYLHKYMNMREHVDLSFYTGELKSLLDQMEKMLTTSLDIRIVQITEILTETITFWDVLLEDTSLYNTYMRKLFDLLIRIRKILIKDNLARAHVNDAEIDMDSMEWNHIKDNKLNRVEFCIGYYFVHFQLMKDIWKSDNNMRALDDFLGARISDKFICTVAVFNMKRADRVEITLEFGKYLCERDDKEAVELGEAIVCLCMCFHYVPAFLYRLSQMKKQKDWDGAFDVLVYAEKWAPEFVDREMAVMKHLDEGVPVAVKLHIDNWYKQRAVFHGPLMSLLEYHEFFYGLKSHIQEYKPVYYTTLELMEFCHKVPVLCPFVMDFISTRRIEDAKFYNHLAWYIEVFFDMWMCMLKDPVWKNMGILGCYECDWEYLYRELMLRGWIIKHPDGTETARCPRLARA